MAHALFKFHLLPVHDQGQGASGTVLILTNVAGVGLGGVVAQVAEVGGGSHLGLRVLHQGLDGLVDPGHHGPDLLGGHIPFQQGSGFLRHRLERRPALIGIAVLRQTGDPVQGRDQVGRIHQLVQGLPQGLLRRLDLGLFRGGGIVQDLLSGSHLLFQDGPGVAGVVRRIHGIALVHQGPQAGQVFAVVRQGIQLLLGGLGQLHRVAEAIVHLLAEHILRRHQVLVVLQGLVPLALAVPAGVGVGVIAVGIDVRHIHRVRVQEGQRHLQHPLLRAQTADVPALAAAPGVGGVAIHTALQVEGLVPGAGQIVPQAHLVLVLFRHGVGVGVPVQHVHIGLEQQGGGQGVALGGLAGPAVGVVRHALDAPGEQGGDVFLHLGRVLADALIAQDALGAEQVGVGPLQAGRHPLVMDGEDQLVPGGGFHHFLHISLILLGADIDEAGLHALDAPFFKFREQLLSAEAVPAAGVGKVDAVDIQDDPHALAVGIVADQGDVHIGLGTAGLAQLAIDIEALAPGVEHAFPVGQEGVVPLPGKVLLQQDLIALHRGVQQGGVQPGIAVDIELRAVPARIQQYILDTVLRGLVHDVLDGRGVHAAGRPQAGTGLHPLGELVGILVRRLVQVQGDGAVLRQFHFRRADHKGPPGGGRRGPGLHIHGGEHLGLNRPIRRGILLQGHDAVVIQIGLADRQHRPVAVLQGHGPLIIGAGGERLHPHLLGDRLIVLHMDAGHRPGREDELGGLSGDLVGFLALGQYIAHSHAGLISPDLQGDRELPAGQGDGGRLVIVPVFALLTGHRGPGGVALAVSDLTHGEALGQVPQSGGQAQLGRLDHGHAVKGDFIVRDAFFQPDADAGTDAFRRVYRDRVCAGRAGRRGHGQHHGQHQYQRAQLLWQTGSARLLPVEHMRFSFLFCGAWTFSVRL